MTRVKICGIQEPEHAIVVAEAGADFIGLVFVHNRHRRLTVDAAQAVVAKLRSSAGERLQVVGLFADQPLEDVNRTIQDCHLDAAQLCGRESVEYCQQVQARVIKVLHVSSPPHPPLIEGGDGEVPPFEIEAGLSVPKGGPGGIAYPSGRYTMSELGIDDIVRRIRAHREAGHLVTLDRQVNGLQGGTGQSFDWRIAAELSRQGHSFLLAGGLTPNNVGQAIAAVQPWGVDVSSGVETGGVKDPDKIRAFIKNAKGVAL